ncbi:LysR family transcriptional regulator [Actimicrobium antarcticum]
MDFTQLRAFITIAREGNLTRAAQRLNLTQPAVSLQLKSLQTTLDVKLFIRTPGGMQLTDDGKKLLPYAERIMEGVAEFHQGVRAMQSTVAGPLSIGTILDAEFTRLGAFLKRLVENYPQLSTELRQGMSGNVLDQVKSGALDVGFYLGIPPKEFHHQVLTTFTYNVVAPQGWKARVAGKDWDALAELPWIWAPPESAHHRLLSKKFSAHKTLPEKVALVDQESSMLDLVKSGVGLSLARESIALHEAHVHGLVIADAVSLSTELSFIALQSRKNEPAIHAAFGLLKALWSH